MNKKVPSRGPDAGLKQALAETSVRSRFNSVRRDLAGPSASSGLSVNDHTLAGRLYFLKGASRLQNDELARAFGVSESGFKKWLAGNAEPSLKNLIGIQDVTGFALQWIATGEGQMFHDEAAAGALPADGFVYVPRYDVRVGAGAGQVIESENLKGFLAFREDWVRSRLRRNPATLVVFEAFGDSMSPTIADGDIMLVDTSEDRVRGSAIYVVLAGNEAIVKRIELQLDGSLLVKSDNEQYERRSLRGEQLADLRVLGKVVWTGGMV